MPNPVPAVRKRKKVPRGFAVSTRPTNLLAKEKQRKALELRKAGATFQQIADQVGWKNTSSAYQAVKQALEDAIREPREEVRDLQYERLNHMLLTLWPQIQAGDRGAMDTALRIMDKMDRIIGTDAPTQHEVAHSGAVLVIQSDEDEYINGLKRMAGYIDVESQEVLPDPPKALTPADFVTPETKTAPEKPKARRKKKKREAAPSPIFFSPGDP